MEVNVLLVDDSKVIRTKVQQLLESDPEYHFIIHLCDDGKQALRHLSSCDEEDLPDIVILDRNMPNMTGDECIRIIKKDESWRSIPILLLTAQNDTSEIVHGLLQLKADDYLPKPFDDREMLARVKVLVRMQLAEEKTKALIREMEQANHSIQQLNKDLEKANIFIRKTFGRYLSDEIVDILLASEEGLSMGGEKRKVTVMMSDLRGFTTLSEKLPAEDVVKMLNHYLDLMTEIIFEYHGTIDEFIGDAILAIFGAPTTHEEDAQRAVACALKMQLAMESVNQYNEKMGYPKITMGIGLHTGTVVVGNIGSQKRTKYGVVGSDVNLTSRIESYTIGGQVLISENTLSECGSILRIDQQMQVTPKGVKEAITISHISGIGGHFNIYLPLKQQQCIELENKIGVQFSVLSEKNIEADRHQGFLVKIERSNAEMECTLELQIFSNLKMDLYDSVGNKVVGEVYAKVLKLISHTPPRFLLALTSFSQEIQHFLDEQIKASSSEITKTGEPLIPSEEPVSQNKKRKKGKKV
ncbi:MAG: adenylate/guanylate cyclase domain-containing protein [Planctomycetota bacterium]